MDIIFLRDLRIDTIIGIYDWERENRQTVILDLEMSTDVARAAATDDIRDALNYKDIAKRLIQFVGESEFQLVETLAEDLGSSSLLYSWVKDTHKLMGVWTDNQGNVYQCLFADQKVIVIDDEGSREFLNVGGTWSPTGGVFDQEGNLWLLEYSIRNRARVRKFDKSGELLDEFYPEE